jgi:hypothetical protein
MPTILPPLNPHIQLINLQHQRKINIFNHFGFNDADPQDAIKYQEMIALLGTDRIINPPTWDGPWIFPDWPYPKVN